MKTLFLMFLFLPFFMVGQTEGEAPNFEFISLSLDPQNLLWGSSKNDPGLDIVVKVGARRGRFQMAIFYENFDLIRYHSYGIQPSLVVDPFSGPFFKEISFLLGGEASVIDRYGPSYFSYGFNAETEIFLGSLLRNLFVFAKADLKRRPDVGQDWCYSNYIGLGLRF